MGKIVISTNVSLDGVVQDPDGGEGSAVGGWFARSAGKDLEAWADVEHEEARRAEALLLGRRSDEWFAERWASRQGDWADRLNSLPKYVVTSTLDQARWGNAVIVKGDVVQEISKLRRVIAGDLVVYGSGRLCRTLLENDLVDELRLFIFPVILGAGQRLFGEITERKPLRLMDTRTVGESLVLATYQPARNL